MSASLRAPPRAGYGVSRSTRACTILVLRLLISAESVRAGFCARSKILEISIETVGYPAHPMACFSLFRDSGSAAQAFA